MFVRTTLIVVPKPANAFIGASIHLTYVIAYAIKVIQFISN